LEIAIGKLAILAISRWRVTNYLSSRRLVQLRKPKTELEISITISISGLIILNGAKVEIPRTPNPKSIRKSRAIKPETTSPVRHKILGIHDLKGTSRNHLVPIRRLNG